MPPVLPEPPELNTPALLEAFFERSRDGCFFMMIDQAVEWGPGVDKDAVLDYVFAHQRMTKVNPAMAEQFRASPAALIGLTPGDFYQHDIEAGRRGWRALFDAGHSHSITHERRRDGTVMWVEGDYMCFYDADGRIAGHCVNRPGVLLCEKVTDPAFYDWIDHHARPVYAQSWFAFGFTTLCSTPTGRA